MAKRAIRPKDAATLVLVRREGGDARVLMGQRHKRQVFMPERYVFPGGGVELCDRYVRPSAELRADVTARLSRACTPSRARALAAAAIRETYEETGLMLAARLDKPKRDGRPEWRAFHERGLGPAFDRLDYIYRAVTPPGPPRRFNARFFMADATDLQGEISGNGELQNIGWIPIAEALAMPIPRITGVVLREVQRLLHKPPARSPDAPVPLLHRVRGVHVLTHE